MMSVSTDYPEKGLGWVTSVNDLDYQFAYHSCESYKKIGRGFFLNTNLEGDKWVSKAISLLIYCAVRNKNTANIHSLVFLYNTQK